MLPSPSPPGNKDISITYSVLIRNIDLNGQTQIAIHGSPELPLNDAVTKILMF